MPSSSPLPPAIAGLLPPALVDRVGAAIAFVTAQDASRLASFAALALALFLAAKALLAPRVPAIAVALTPEERDGMPGKPRWVPGTPFPKDTIPCYDPGSLEMLGPNMRADTAADVRAKIARAREAQKVWAESSFMTRRLLLKTIARFVLENQDDICRVSARDSGKPLVDAAFGEILVTLEKIKWLLAEGERWLRPERRSSGLMMFYKTARVEYRPCGVMGAIVPWNYPFHNVFNPLVANLFAGNALVVKVSEYASWSSLYYGRAIQACLEAVGAPPDLVQIVHGYGEAGNALVTGGVDKLVFVGSTHVGKLVMKAAAETLTTLDVCGCVGVPPEMRTREGLLELFPRLGTFVVHTG